MPKLSVLPSERLLKRTRSRCPVCLAAIPADIVQRENAVFMRKSCEEHGAFEVAVADDTNHYHLSQGSPENSESCCGGTCEPRGDDSRFERLSTCIALIEIVDSCNLTCPTCYASSPLGTGENIDCISFDKFVRRVQGVLDRKGFVDILQLSGGEPTLHPQFFDILEWSLRHELIGYILINTNAVRIATDDAFRERLGEMRRDLGGFELYVQFDGPQEGGQVELRGADLRRIREQAIDRAGADGVPSTLAMVVTPTTIAHLGDTLRFGLTRKHVRGITFQPMFMSGRIPTDVESTTLPIMPQAERDSPKPISVGDVIHAVVGQSRGVLAEEDFTPLPCGDPNCHTVGYLLRTHDDIVGLSRLLDLPALQDFLADRTNYSMDDLLRCGCETEPLGELLKEIELSPDAPFRMFIKPFMDAWMFDEDRIDRCCTHVIRPDGELDSFCNYYLQQSAS